MTKLFGYSCVALFALIAQPASAEYWVAVAVNKNVGQHGNSYFLASRNEAVSSAMYHCKTYSDGADGCEVVLATKKCSGMAHAGPNIHVSEGRTAGTAGSKALKSCQSEHGSACRIHETFCPNG
jgi:hypothetical protein